MPNNFNFLRVKKNSPCPICGKPDWCLIAQDGKAAICARVESPIKSGDAGWLHLLDKGITPPPAPVPPPNLVNRAPIEQLHAVYSALLGLLTLSGDHQENLHGRGLDDIDIKELGYKSMPAANRYPIVKQLLTRGYKLAGVPGFYFDKGWRLGGPAGILIPVRDDQHHIQGFQIRRDGSAKPKYMWLSSVKQPGGCSPGAPLHVAYPGRYFIGCQKDGLCKVWITEGPLKADIAAISLQNIVLAVAGVGNWSAVIPFLQTHFPMHSLVKVIIAFDMDRDENPAVANHLNDLSERLLQLCFYTYIAKWDFEKKGIDDLCQKHELNQKSR